MKKELLGKLILSADLLLGMANMIDLGNDYLSRIDKKPKIENTEQEIRINTSYEMSGSGIDYGFQNLR